MLPDSTEPIPAAARAVAGVARTTCHRRATGKAEPPAKCVGKAGEVLALLAEMPGAGGLRRRLPGWRRGREDMAQQAGEAPPPPSPTCCDSPHIPGIWCRSLANVALAHIATNDRPPAMPNPRRGGRAHPQQRRAGSNRPTAGPNPGSWGKTWPTWRGSLRTRSSLRGGGIRHDTRK